MSLVTLPTASEMISGTTAYSSSWFTEFLPLIYVAVGVLVAVVLVKYISRTIKGGIKGVAGGGKRRSKKRRY